MKIGYNKKYNIEDMHDLALAKNGKCLSSVYQGAHSILEWECHLEHKFPASANNVRRGKWCPDCARIRINQSKIKYTIEGMRELAMSKNGQCLSNIYVSYNKKLMWKCENNHEFPATPGKIISGTWCPNCIGRGKTIEDMNELAKKNLEDVCQ